MTSSKRQHEPAHTHQCERREAISSQIQRSREAVQTLRASILRLGFSTAREIGTERYALRRCGATSDRYGINRRRRSPEC